MSRISPKLTVVSLRLDSKKIGEGTYGSVAIGVHQQTNVERAVKTMSKGSLDTDGVQPSVQDSAVSITRCEPCLKKYSR